MFFPFEDIEGIIKILRYKVAKYFLNFLLNNRSFTYFIYLNTIKTSFKIFHHSFIVVFFFLVFFKGNAQKGLSLPNGVEKDKISFQLINNLVVIPVEVNGNKLNFLLDTGVSSTIMFSMVEADSLILRNARSIKLRGIGNEKPITALKSNNNTIKIGKAIDVNHSIFVIYGDKLDLSARMGIPIHGIIGYEFFNSFIVKTNYLSEKIVFYNLGYLVPKLDKYKEFDLIIKNNKPFLNVEISEINTFKNKIVLIDSGSSDAIWLFNDEVFDINPTKKYFDDFLGQGLSGVVYGKRSKLSTLLIGGFKLEEVKVAYPDEKAIENIKFYKERDGSLGGELLMRFAVIIDYSSKKIYLKKNNNFKKPFHYNMSGISIKHDGAVLIKEKQGTPINNQENDGAVTIRLSTIYNFYLVPRFVISEIRKGSPAELAGFKVGDEIKTINGRAIHKYQLTKIIGVFSSKAGKKIILEVNRSGILFTKKFNLLKVL